jgi:sporulation protein YlmC with PRC-barrel domain
MTAEGSWCGRIKDVYFNDRTWTITHLLLRIGAKRVAQEEVLAGSDQVTRICAQEGAVHFRLNSGAFAELPPSSSVLPVCKQYAALAFGSPGARLLGDQFKSLNPNIRAAKAVVGYSIQARGQSCGRLEDLIFDEESFEIRYLAIGQLEAGKKLRFLIVPQSVERFTWATQRVVLRELQAVCLDGGQKDATISRAA